MITHDSVADYNSLFNQYSAESIDTLTPAYSPPGLEMVNSAKKPSIMHLRNQSPMRAVPQCSSWRNSPNQSNLIREETSGPVMIGNPSPIEVKTGQIWKDLLVSPRHNMEEMQQKMSSRNQKDLVHGHPKLQMFSRTSILDGYNRTRYNDSRVARWHAGKGFSPNGRRGQTKYSSMDKWGGNKLHQPRTQFPAIRKHPSRSPKR